MNSLNKLLIKPTIIDSPSSENIESKSNLFDQSSVVFGLFIGYLVSGATHYKVEEYETISHAYLGIQLRGAAAIIGTYCMLITSFIDYCVDEILSLDIKIDSEENELKRRIAIYNFLKALSYIQVGILIVSYLCFIFFIVCFTVSLYSLYYKNLDFTIFIIIISLLTFFVLSSLLYIFYQKKKTIKLVKTY